MLEEICLENSKDINQQGLSESLDYCLRLLQIKFI